MDSPLFWMMKKSRAMLPYMPKWTYPLFCSLAYLICIRKVLHLRKPRTFTEKIQWMKFHDSTEMKSRLSDKYLVKEWVREKIGDQYVIPLLGAWDTFDEIDFDKLPSKFVLKLNHGCGFNYFVPDKDRLDYADARRKIEQWRKTAFEFSSFEMHYAAIQRKIIAEEYIENLADEYVNDYKAWCFQGKVLFILYLTDRRNGLKEVYLDRNWSVLPLASGVASKITEVPEKPENLEEFIRISERLAAGIPFVRVDFYRLNDGSFRFGEMTFTPCGGFIRWSPKEWDLKLGNLLTLPSVEK